MKASDLLVRCLEEEGVEYIFGVPGEENADVMISLLDSSIRFVVCRHEQAAAFMADAYGRLTGKAAVCLGTLGPGATNLLTGVGDANMDRAPLVVLTGQAATTRLHKESHQVTDLVRIFQPCVKWGASVQHPDAIPEIVRKAFRVATTDKYGACHIDLPENVAHMETLARPIAPEPVPRPSPDDAAVADAAARVRKAKFPMLLTGNGVFRHGATDALRAFVEATGIPAVNTFMGKGGVPPSDARCLFTVGLGARDWPAVALERADCVLAVGFDMVEYHPKLWNKGNRKCLVHVDMSPAEIDENYRADVEVVGDIAEALDLLREALEGVRGPDAKQSADVRGARGEALAAPESDELDGVWREDVWGDVRKALDDRDIVLSDVGAHKMWIARHLHTEEPNTILISNGWCSMGFALPGAIGAKLVYPDRRVLAICGDGGVMMNIQDLETAVREKIDIVVLEWTDSAYGLARWQQETSFGKHSHIAFTNPDWMKLAYAFGMKGYRVAKAADLPGALKEAFAAGGSALIEVPVDYAENLKLSGRLKEIPFAHLCGCLEDVELFKGLPERYRRAIAERMGEQRFAKGETVFAEGDEGDTVYVVHEGKATVRRQGKDVATLGHGEAFGEMAALDPGKRNATVVAATDLVCGTLSGAEFREMLRADPDLTLHLAKTYARS